MKNTYPPRRHLLQYSLLALGVASTVWSASAVAAEA